MLRKFFFCTLALSCSLQTLFAQEINTSQKQNSTLRQQAVKTTLEKILEEKIYSHKETKSGASSNSELLGQTETGISTTNNYEAEIHAAVNPLDTNNIVVSIISAGGSGLTMPVFYTKDFGKSWKRVSFAPAMIGGGDPMFAFDVNGNLYYSWIELAQVDGFKMRPSMLFASSTNGGQSWSKMDTVTTGLLDFSTGGGYMCDKQWMAVDHSSSSPWRNTLYMSLLEMQLENNELGIFIRKKDPNSAKFSKKAVQASDKNFVAVQFSSVAVDADGHVHVFFRGSRDNQYYSLWHYMSTDGGENFSTGDSVAFTRVLVPGPNAQTRENFPPRFDSSPQFTADANPKSIFKNNLYAVWTANEPGDDDATFDEPLYIYFSRSANKGKTWSAPIRVDNGKTTFRSDQFFPSIDVNPDGVIVISWYDNSSNKNGRQAHAYIATSYNGGETFATKKRAPTGFTDFNSLGSFGLGDYTKIVTTSHYAIPFWADGRKNNGDVDLYTAFIPLDSSLAPSVVKNISESSEVTIGPNPVATDGLIRITIERDMEGLIEITDIHGKIIEFRPEKKFLNGVNTERINISQYASGTYFLHLRTKDAVITKEFTVIK